MLSLVVLLSAMLPHEVPLEVPFKNIQKAEVAFHVLERDFRKYRFALNECAPEYDINRSPGPPFDMYYHLEVLHRMLANMSHMIHDASEYWHVLKTV